MSSSSLKIQDQPLELDSDCCVSQTKYIYVYNLDERLNSPIANIPPFFSWASELDTISKIWWFNSSINPVDSSRGGFAQLGRHIVLEIFRCLSSDFIAPTLQPHQQLLLLHHHENPSRESVWFQCFLVFIFWSDAMFSLPPTFAWLPSQPLRHFPAAFQSSYNLRFGARTPGGEGFWRAIRKLSS